LLLKKLILKKLEPKLLIGKAALLNAGFFGALFATNAYHSGDSNIYYIEVDEGFDYGGGFGGYGGHGGYGYPSFGNYGIGFAGGYVGY